MKKTDTVNWGIIGCGDVTEVKSGPALQKIAKSRIVAVMRRNATKAEDYARRHGISEWFTDAESIINHPDINAVYVATPPATHMSYTISALQKRKPVYVEKPMALNYSQCLKMVEAAQKFKTKLFVAYYRRSLPAIKKIRQILESGILGRIQLVTIRFYKAVDPGHLQKGDLAWRLYPEISGGGLLYDLASHQLDLLDFLFGPIKEVVSITANQDRLYPAEDISGATFLFEKGLIGNAIWCFCSSALNDTDEIEIMGKKGRVSFSTFAFTPIKVKLLDKNQEFDYPKPKHVEQPMLESVVAELLGTGKCPSTGETAARTNLILDKITEKLVQL